MFGLFCCSKCSLYYPVKYSVKGVCFVCKGFQIKDIPKEEQEIDKRQEAIRYIMERVTPVTPLIEPTKDD